MLYRGLYLSPTICNNARTCKWVRACVCVCVCVCVYLHICVMLALAICVSLLTGAFTSPPHRVMVIRSFNGDLYVSASARRRCRLSGSRSSERRAFFSSSVSVGVGESPWLVASGESLLGFASGESPWVMGDSELDMIMCGPSELGGNNSVSFSIRLQYA